MLVLSRKKRQEIVIDTPAGPVRVSVEAIKGNQVQLGVVADVGTKVYRREVWDKITAGEPRPTPRAA